MGIVELGGIIITQATQRVESAAQNIANTTTAGYKTRHHFQQLIDGGNTAITTARIGQTSDSLVDFTAGKLQHTGNPYDLAISGSGFFTVRASDELLYTRSGQFSRNADGYLVTLDGAVLQSRSGDVQLESGDLTVLADGTMQQNGQPISQLAIATFDDTSVLRPVGMGLFSAPVNAAKDVGVAQVRQGMLETSNVTTADEMISIMAGLRSAESGQRLVQIYDDLMGRVLATFGQT